MNSTAIRGKPIYVTNQVYDALWMIAKSRVNEQGYVSTPDEVANTFLHHKISEHAPHIWEHQQKVKQMEAEAIAKLATSGLSDGVQPAKSV